jgi:NADH-quinone oxidoreductase subunit M
MELHFPWLEVAVLLSLAGALWVASPPGRRRARINSLAVSGLTLLCTIAAWYDFVSLHTFQAHDRWDVAHLLFRADLLVVDELSAPLLPLAALLYFLTMLATLRTKLRRFSFPRALAAEAIVLATLSCKLPWVVVALLAAGAVPPLLELRSRGAPTRIFALHMGLFVALLAGGQSLLEFGGPILQLIGVLLLAAAVLLRSGVVPVHCWMTDLFEHASFGTALLFVTPMVGAYGAMRLVLPIAPDWVLQAISIVSLFTAVYAAGMALVQTEARRFFCYLFLSHASLVLVGLEIATPITLAGALCVWLSVGLSLGGFGLTLRSVEARTGRLSLTEFHGLCAHVPMLAAFFLLTGLASVGFPGTIGFVGAELLVEGVVRASPLVGVVVVIAAALNGLAVLHAYFRVFTGARHAASIDLHSRPPERIAVLLLSVLILGGGLYPQPGIDSRYHAAVELVEARRKSLGSGAALHVDVARRDAGREEEMKDER